MHIVIRISYVTLFCFSLFFFTKFYVQLIVHLLFSTSTSYSSKSNNNNNNNENY